MTEEGGVFQKNHPNQPLAYKSLHHDYTDRTLGGKTLQYQIPNKVSEAVFITQDWMVLPRACSKMCEGIFGCHQEVLLAFSGGGQGR